MVENRMNTKTCKTCGERFPKTEEYFYYSDKKRGYFKSCCRECDKARRSKRYQDNREYDLEQQREYRSRPENKKKVNERLKRRRKENPHLKRMLSAHYAICKGMINPESVTKRNKVWSALPYTPWDLRRHLEDQFEDWMSWDNRGKGRHKWGLDHIVPQSHFYWETLQDDSFQECWALSNLRPLCSIENIKKGNTLDATKHS